jgi:hypothetical protein
MMTYNNPFYSYIKTPELDKALLTKHSKITVATDGPPIQSSPVPAAEYRLPHRNAGKLGSMRYAAQKEHLFGLFIG